MSKTVIEKIVRKVVDETGDEIKATYDKELEHSLEILEATKRKTVMEVEKIQESTKGQAETIKRRIIGSAELATRNKNLEFIESTINDIFEKTIKKLEEKVTSEEYKSSLKQLLEEGADMIASKDLIVSANKKDYKILKEFVDVVAQAKDANIKIDEKPIGCIGGVKIRSSEGTTFFDNTIEARLERFKPILRRNIGQLFMGKG
ncbi:MAG: hypothetical protein L6N96_01555 [Candidatus Methylarchaceae archaeon HK02M2]|nr:hypothetical protein [Candidatus Methylarchaceae archaeon HK02M2]